MTILTAIFLAATQMLPIGCLNDDDHVVVNPVRSVSRGTNEVLVASGDVSDIASAAESENGSQSRIDVMGTVWIPSLENVWVGGTLDSSNSVYGGSTLETAIKYGGGEKPIEDIRKDLESLSGVVSNIVDTVVYSTNVDVRIVNGMKIMILKGDSL